MIFDLLEKGRGEFGIKSDLVKEKKRKDFFILVLQ